MSGLELRRGPCTCARPGCNLSWPRDPCLEIECPACGAPAGIGCRRPSGHSGQFVDLHAARDLAADAAEAYGPCPLGLCGVGRQPEQQEMFE